MTTGQRLDGLRQELARLGLQGYIQPVHDEFMSEYPPACFQRVRFLSGFSGSAGMVAVLEHKAALFTDGRYTLQAASETDAAFFEMHNSGELAPEAWLAQTAQGARIGYDPMLFSDTALTRMKAALDKQKTALVPVANLADTVWKDRPPSPATQIVLHDERFAGQSARDKLANVAAELKKAGARAALIAAPDSVCWLLNIRARDVECTPLVLARAIAYDDGSADLFVDSARLPPLPDFVRAFAPSQMQARLGILKDKAVLVDMAQTPEALLSMLKQAGTNIVRGQDPCVLPKACKNEVQLNGMRAAHQRDGVAIAKLLYWLDSHPAIHSVSEMEIADKLLSLRAQGELFVEPSFPTIAGSGPNGAIVHYRADEKSNRSLRPGELLLLDSGGQYLDGTTDITRTIAIGTPTDEYKDRFTRLLKGHIALAMAAFPKGTRGSQLDVLARAPLWAVGLDYDHGTGHGVGQYLGVHEGPQRISKRGGDAELQPGMILSNEPGYYKTGAYGIRIENLVAVIAREDNYLAFETITCAPMDMRLIEPSLFSAEEKTWLNRYHAWVKASLSPRLSAEECAWLEQRLTDLL